MKLFTLIFLLIPFSVLATPSQNVSQKEVPSSTIVPPTTKGVDKCADLEHKYLRHKPSKARVEWVRKKCAEALRTTPSMPPSLE